MQTHTILIITGTLLLLAGVIGGGLSLKEVKLPSLDRNSRALASLVGVVLIVAGIYIERSQPDSGTHADGSVSDRQSGLEQNREQVDSQRDEEAHQAELERQRVEEEHQAELERQRAEEEHQAELERQRAEEEHQAELERQRAEEERQADIRLRALQWREDFETQGGRIAAVSDFEQRHDRGRLFEVAAYRFPVRACPDCDFGFVFQCRIPVSSTDELSRLKVHAQSGIVAAGIEHLVGDIAVFPATEIYQALQTGAVDCYSAVVRF